MCLTMFKQGIIDRESKAFSLAKDPSLKYVLSLDSVDMLHNDVFVVQSRLSKLDIKIYPA